MAGFEGVTEQFKLAKKLRAIWHIYHKHKRSVRNLSVYSNMPKLPPHTHTQTQTHNHTW